MIKFISKIITILLVAIFVLNMSANAIFAAVEVTINKAYIEKIGEAKHHLKYYREEKEMYTYLMCDIVGFYDKDKNRIGEEYFRYTAARDKCKKNILSGTSSAS